MRRRSNQPTISLFSFQDIVTSVTAILILVVLILTLELITRKFEAKAVDPAASARTVADAVMELESLVNRLASSAAPEGRLLASLVSPAVPQAELRVLRDQVERARNKVCDAQRVADLAKKFASEAMSMLAREQAQSEKAVADEQQATRLTQETGTLVAENAREQSKLEAQRLELEGHPLPGPELVFRRPRGTSKRSWLLEVSDKGFFVLELGTGKTRPLGNESDNESELSRWISSLTPNSDYVLLLVRPTGIETERRARERLMSAKVPHGIDFIGEEQAVHDGSMGEDSRATSASSGAAG